MDSIIATVVSPVGVTAQVTLPLYGIAANEAVVTESGTTIWRNGQYVAGDQGEPSQ